MKILNYISKISIAAMLLIFAVTGCKETAESSIDPIERDTLITFTPSHGYPGTTVIISGSGLGDVTAVGFGNIDGEILAKSENEIRAIVPIGSISAKIKLAKPGSVITSLTDFKVDATPIPTIAKFDPSFAGSGDVVTITGSLLGDVDSVYIGTLKAEIQAGRTASEIKVVCPSGLKTAKINMYYTYTTSYGMDKVATSSSDKELNLALPTIDSYSAVITELDVNQQFQIKGKMMSEVTAVNFVNRVAGYTGTDTVKNVPVFSAIGDTVLNVTVPAGATTGVIKLTILDGTITSSTYQVNLPVISSFTPSKGYDNMAIDSFRIFTVQGTKLNLVNSVTVGAVAATITSKTENTLIFTLSKVTATGKINLATTNGTVSSSAPFYLAGTFMLADFDNMYTPVRLFNEPMYTGVGGSESFQDAVTTAASKSIGNKGDSYGNFRRFDVTFKAGSSSPRIYIRGDQGGSANPAPDRFLLYTTSSAGVTFDFDISWDVIPAAMVVNGSVDLKVMFFNADQGAGGGYGYYSTIIKVPYTGAGVWQHVSVNTNATRVANDSYMYNTSVPAVSTPKFNPANCRIVTIMFQSAYGTAAENQQMIVNYDNVKFVIN